MSTYRIQVWDPPIRIVHWLLFALVSAAFVTGLQGGNLMLWHGRIGLAITGLLTFRLVWGFIGSTYARFAQFAPRPATVRDYLAGRWRGVGHNPLGALSVLALLTILALQTLTGLFGNDDIAFEGPLYALVSKSTSDWMIGIHRQLIWPLGGLILLHIGAILFYLWARGHNLLLPMLTGHCRTEDPNQRSAQGGGWLAMLIALALAAAAVWIAAGGLIAPAPPPLDVPDW